MQRATVFNVVHDRLGALATGAGFTASEASYKYCLNEALRYLTGGILISVVEKEDYDRLCMLTEQAALRKLRAFYAVQVDTAVGSRRESLSQIVATINKMISKPAMSMDTTFDPGEADFSLTGESIPVNIFEITGSEGY